MRDGCAFQGRNVELARRFRGLTQCELATAVAISNALVCRYEHDMLSAPPLNLVAAWAEILGFEPGFFFVRIQDPFRAEECSLRCHTMPEHVKKQARAFGTLVGVIVGYLKKRARFPAYRVPSFPLDGARDTIERAAAGSRASFALHPDAPIVSVIQVLEDAGVPIVTTLRSPRSVGVFSRRGRTAVVIANRDATSPSQWNVDLACELGHFVCHMDVPTNSMEAGDEAYAFALAFLMPGGPFARDFTAKPLSKDRVLVLRDRWRVSGSAIIDRAHSLGLMDAVRYRCARRELPAESLSPAGPPGPVEEPVLLRRSLLSLHTSGEHPLDTCQRLQIRPSTFRELTGVDVHGDSALDAAAANSSAPYSL